MLLRFVPMRSGSQQCVNVVQRTRTFTAITRVQIPSGTPIKINNLNDNPSFLLGPRVTERGSPVHGRWLPPGHADEGMTKHCGPPTLALPQNSVLHGRK